MEVEPQKIIVQLSMEELEAIFERIIEKHLDKRQHEYEDEMPLKMLGLRRYIVERLTAKGVRTLGQLCKITHDDLVAIYGLKKIQADRVELALQQKYSRHLAIRCVPDDNINEDENELPQ